MSDLGARPSGSYRDHIVRTLTPVRPLASPSRRVRVLVPLGLVVALIGPTLSGPRGDLAGVSPLLTWGVSSVQALLGLWFLTLGFREAVPGSNVSRRALILASALAVVLIASVTVLTNLASATVVPAGRELRDWVECVIGPMALGASLMILATLMVARAFPTRPAIAGALCGVSAGLLSDAGWRLSCWISAPSHVISSHGVALLGLAAAGSLLAMVVDMKRWRGRFVAS